MYPPHVIAKVTLVWELPFTNITFYVEASAWMLLLLVPLQTGDVIPAQTRWALFLSCKIISGLWSSTKYEHWAKTNNPLKVHEGAFISVEISRQCVGVWCALEESFCSCRSCYSMGKWLPPVHLHVRPSYVDQSYLQKYFYHKSGSKLDLQFLRVYSYLFRNDIHYVSLANAFDKTNHFWKSSDTLGTWHDYSSHGHPSCALRSA